MKRFVLILVIAIAIPVTAGEVILSSLRYSYTVPEVKPRLPYGYGKLDLTTQQECCIKCAVLPYDQEIKRLQVMEAVVRDLKEKKSRSYLTTSQIQNLNNQRRSRSKSKKQ